MTKINKMIMHGFKSFAKHTEMLFNDNFNCVLGPNGSGKSNVLDALCFVLGRSSSKSLRAEKASNLIYNGGKLKKPSKQGEVSVYFDNTSKRFPTDEPEIKITRVVTQSGQSIYKINDKKRTRQQILELLSLAKIDPNGYNIILQGDIAQFVELPHTERRMLIEEISGISIYEEKKQKALNELEKVDARLKEAEIIMAERSTYLKELKRDRDEALKFREMNEKVIENKASLLKLQINAKESELKDMQQKIGKAAEELNNINGAIAQIKKENEEKKKQIEDITNEIEEKGEVEQLRLNKEIESLKIDLTKNTSRLETCKNEIAKLKQRKQDLKNDLDEISRKLSELIKEKSELQKKKSLFSKEKDAIHDKIRRFRESNKIENAAGIEKELENIDIELEKSVKEANELREKQHSLIREKDALMHKFNTADEKISKVSRLEKEYTEQIEALKAKRQDFKQATLELNKRLDEDSSLSQQLSNARAKRNISGEELAKLRARDISIKEYSSADIAVKKVLEQKNKRKGIYGTVADLGSVDAKYSLALEIAAGPRIRSVVVEDDRTAAELIKYLKQSRLGIATFLPLNKLRSKSTGPEIKNLSDANGCHGLAIDLVRYDEKFKKVFDYVFSDTLIVDSIDVARRLGIGRARMATIDGDLAEISGVMQGGYRKDRKGLGFRETEVAKEISECENAISGLENAISAFEKRRAENEETIAKLRERKALLEGEIIKTEKSLHLEPGEVEINRQLKKSLEKDIAAKDDEISKISEKISGINREIMGNKEEKQKLRAQISELRDPALLAELTAFEQKSRELGEYIIKIDEQLKGIEMQISSIHTPEKEKTLQILRQIDKDEQDFNKELSGINKKIAEQQGFLDKKEASAKEFYSRFKSLFSKRSKITEEIQKNEAQIEAKQETSRSAEIRNNTFSLKKAEFAAALSGMSQEFQQYEGVKLDMAKNEQQLKVEIAKFEKLKAEIGAVNMRALEIYSEIEKEYGALLEKKGKLVNEKDDVLAMMKEIEGKKKDLFMRTYNVINENFVKIFQQLTTKGAAHLELENEENPFEGGLFVKVKITGNKFLDIRSLSGGEKTLTALAFIFAIQEHEPASFYVLDEVDAALDKHNSEKLAKLVRKYSENAQYIIISHNDGIISEATNLYGVSMDENSMSKVVSLKI